MKMKAYLHSHSNKMSPDDGWRAEAEYRIVPDRRPGVKPVRSARGTMVIHFGMRTAAADSEIRDLFDLSGEYEIEIRRVR